MFNRCWRWRGLLSRRADSVLTTQQWGRLQDHLASCAHCRSLVEADDALQSVLGVNPVPLSPEQARRFDDAVLVSLASSSGSRVALSSLISLRPYLRKFRAFLRVNLKDLPLSFLGQVGGGALVAGCLTSFFLLPALHSGSNGAGRSGAGVVRSAESGANGELSGIPVPLASLLNSAAPRAASLWSTPDEGSISDARLKMYRRLHDRSATASPVAARPSERAHSPGSFSDLRLAPVPDMKTDDLDVESQNEIHKESPNSGPESPDTNSQGESNQESNKKDSGLLPTVIMG